MIKWPGKPYRWISDRTLYISIPFTWNLPEIKREILNRDIRYDNVIVGGPAIQLMPQYLADIAIIENNMPGILQKINPMATRSTIGCIRKCKFCGIGQGFIESGSFKELDNWPDLPIYCDNNILAASEKHFLKVIRKLLKHNNPDFNQGLDARLLTKFHAEQLSKLKNPIIRLAWDSKNDEQYIKSAIDKLLQYKMPKRNIRCYILIGYKETPEEALYRLQEISQLGILTNPMRFQPLNALIKNEYVNFDKGWSEKLLIAYMRYWSNQRYFKNIPFKEFEYAQKKRCKGQKTLQE